MKNKTQLFLLQFGNKVFTPTQKKFIMDNFKRCYIIDSHIAETITQKPKFLIHLKLNVKTFKMFKGFKVYTNGQIHDTKRTSVIEVPLDEEIHNAFITGKYDLIPQDSNLSKQKCIEMMHDLKQYTEDINEYYDTFFEEKDLEDHDYYLMPPTADKEALNAETDEFITRIYGS